jgi:O-antigen/teichoic acid export membrane protein
VSPVRIQLSIPQAKINVQLAVPIGLYLLVSLMLFNLDFWCLKIIGAVPNEVIGISAAALNVAKLPDLASLAIRNVLFPSAAITLTARDREAGRRYVQDASRMLLLGLLPFTMLFALTAEPLLTFLYTGTYATGTTLLPWQVCAFALFGIARAYSGMLIAHGSPYLATDLVCLTIPAALALNGSLVPSFGVVGAATWLLLTALFTTVATSWMLVRQCGSLFRFSTLLKALAATALMALIAPSLELTGPWLVLKYVLLLEIYGVVLMLLQELNKDAMLAFSCWRNRQG